MTADAPWAVHPLSDSDLPELLLLDAAAFNIDPPRDFLDEIALPGLEPDRVTWVSVRAGWRRRGLLTAMMRDQLHGLHETGGEAWPSSPPARASSTPDTG